jgi:hypothetical protein
MRLHDVETLHWLPLHPEDDIINYKQSMFDRYADTTDNRNKGELNGQTFRGIILADTEWCRA